MAKSLFNMPQKVKMKLIDCPPADGGEPPAGRPDVF